MSEAVVLTGADLDLEAVWAVASGATVSIHPAALERVAAGSRAADEVASRREVYGRTTGVGAARGESAAPDGEHGLRLLRSHAGSWGEVLPEPVVRAALAIRANQLLVGGSGAGPELATAVAALAGAPTAELPVVHREGSLGVGDLGQLAEVGLTLAGERPRVGGTARRDLELTPSDALPLLSSNAFVLAEAALATAQLERLSRAVNIPCAMSFVALQGNPEALGRLAADATPFPGALAVMEAMRGLVGGNGGTPAHIQDFFGLRTWPQVHGPLVDSLRQLREVVERSVNTASENPVFATGPDGGGVAHHGGFHAAYLALALDMMLLAMARSSRAVRSRVAHLLTGGEQGLPLFLTDATSGSSGLLIAEYVAASAVSLITQCAASPASVMTTSASAGIEDDASFAGLAAARLGRAVLAYRRLVAVELVTAVRALRLRGVEPTGRLGEALAACADLPMETTDRDLTPDFEAAEGILGRYAGWPA